MLVLDQVLLQAGRVHEPLVEPEVAMRSSCPAALCLHIGSRPDLAAHRARSWTTLTAAPRGSHLLHHLGRDRRDWPIQHATRCIKLLFTEVSSAVAYVDHWWID